MVSITNVSAAQAEKYYQRDNYYTKNVGQWQGKGAEALGLRGEIAKEDFMSVIYGKAPDGSFQIQSGGEAQSHRAGVDLTFSAPKSASIVSEVLGDDRVREAHERAVQKTLEYIEKSYSQARQTQGGNTERVNTGNLVIAKFGHDTSRELDPQLHTHCVVMNMTQREDGQWRALSNEKIYEQKMLIGQHYRNEFAKNLREQGYSIQSDHKGFFEIRGVPEKLIEEYSRRTEQIDAKVRELKESGKFPNVSEQKLRELATLDSRVAKGKDINMDIVRASQTERMHEHGYTRESIRESIEREARERHGRGMNEYDIVRAAAAIHTEQESTFSREDILKTAGKLSVGEHRMSDLEKAFTELNHDKEIRQLAENVYTTREMLEIEKDIVEKVQSGHDKMDSISTREQAEQGIKDFESSKGFAMTAGQRDAVEHILTSKDKFVGIQGDAGTGKTTMLAAVREQAEAEGYEVRGFGYTGKAAAEVEQQAGIKSQTLHSFLAQKNIDSQDSQADREHTREALKDKVNSNFDTHFARVTLGSRDIISKLDKLNQLDESRKAALEKIDKAFGEKDTEKKQLWIVDESSMAGSKKMNELMQRAENENAKVVFVGDTKQLQAIEAGRMFSKLQETKDLKTVHMTESLRQKEQGYKDVVKDMSEKKIDKAMDKLDKQGRIHEIADRQERINAIVNDYMKSGQGVQRSGQGVHASGHRDTIIVTDRNTDRNEFNERIRNERKEKDEISKNEHTFTVRESKNLSPIEKHFAQSYDKNNIVIANEKNIIGKNNAGTVARVVSTDQKNHTITVKKDGQEHTIDLKTQGQNLAVYQEKQQSFSKGDEVVFLKNDKSLKVQNGNVGVLKSINENGKAVIKMEDGKDKKINLKTQYSYLDRGYAVTDYKVQGQTSKNVIWHADTSKGVNYNQAYVAKSRGQEDVQVYTNDKKELREQMKTEQRKTTTLDHEKSEKLEKSGKTQDKGGEKNEPER